MYEEFQDYLDEIDYFAKKCVHYTFFKVGLPCQGVDNLIDPNVIVDLEIAYKIQIH